MKTLVLVGAAAIMLAACGDQAGDTGPQVEPSATVTASDVPSGGDEPTSSASATTPDSGGTSTASPSAAGATLAPLTVPQPAQRPTVAYVALADGRLAVVDVATGAIQREITRWDDPDDPEDQEFAGLGSYLDDVAVSADGSVLIADICCEPAAGNLVRVDPSTGESEHVIIGMGPAIRGDSRWVASTPLSQMVALHDLTGEAEAIFFGDANDSGTTLGRPAWDPTGMRVAVAAQTQDGTSGVAILDLATASELDDGVTWPAPAGRVWTAPAFRADGLLLVAEQALDRGDEEPDPTDVEGVLLDPKTGERLADFPLASRVWTMRYDASHTWLLVAHQDGRLTWQGAGQSGTILTDGAYAGAW